jgi:hypothetical protein
VDDENAKRAILAELRRAEKPVCVKLIHAYMKELGFKRCDVCMAILLLSNDGEIEITATNHLAII